MKTLQHTVLLFAGLLAATASWAKGTPAGTPVSNTATATYYSPTDSATPLTAKSTTEFTVQEIIDVTVDSSSTATNVIAGETNVVVTYTVTNTGNGSEEYAIVVANALTGIDFDVENIAIYQEDGTSGFNGTESELATDGLINLNPDEKSVLYVVVSIPATVSVGDEAITNLTATSQTSGASAASAGDVLDNVGDGGTDAVVAIDGAYYQQDHTYTVTANSDLVKVTKKVLSQLDPFGGDSAIPGTETTYQILVEASDAVDNLIITDALPEQVTFVAGSLYLATSDLAGTELTSSNATLLTGSSSDADGGKYEPTLDTNGRVTVSLGDLSAAADYTIQFKVTID